MEFKESTPDKYRCRAITGADGCTTWAIELYLTQSMGWVEVEQRPTEEQALRVVNALNGKQSS